MTNHLAAAKALDELLLELIDKAAAIPDHVAEALKAGRSVAAISARIPEDGEIAVKAFAALESVEMNLLTLAEIAGGAEYADAWQKRIEDARAEELPAAAHASRMVQGVPKGERWIRFQTSELTDADPADFGLTAVPQEDGFTLIYGKKENMTAYLAAVKQANRERFGFHPKT